jgi:hypothetical protein
MNCTPVGALLAAVALQMIASRRELVFPKFITVRSLPTHYLFRVGGHAIRRERPRRRRAAKERDEIAAVACGSTSVEWTGP